MEIIKIIISLTAAVPVAGIAWIVAIIWIKFAHAFINAGKLERRREWL